MPTSLVPLPILPSILLNFFRLASNSADFSAALLSAANLDAASFFSASIRASDFAPSINVGSASIVFCAVFVCISRSSDLVSATLLALLTSLSSVIESEILVSSGVISSTAIFGTVYVVL